MRKTPLLPGYFQWIGLALAGLSLLLYLYDSAESGTDLHLKVFAIVDDTPFQETRVFQMVTADITLTLLLVTSLCGLAFLAFSRSKTEDEMINALRLYSWSWAIAVMLGIFLFFTLFFYGLSFLSFALLFPHLLLVLYISIFRINLLRINRGIPYEK